MTRASIAALLLLSACTHTATLYPKGGGAPVKGEFEFPMRLVVPIDGETYAGTYTQGSRGMDGRNSHSAVLVAPSGKTMRCDFVGSPDAGGNGLCDRAGQQYDMVLTP